MKKLFVVSGSLLAAPIFLFSGISTADAAFLSLLGPQPAECVSRGTSITLLWNTDISGIDKFSLEYTADGTNYSKIAENLPGTNTGYSWVAPNTESSRVRVKLIARNASGEILGEDVSDQDFTIKADCGASDTKPPTFSGVSAWPIFLTGAQIGWTTNEPAISKVEFGLQPSAYTQEVYQYASPWTAAYGTNHAITLSNLLPNTKYYYRVISKDRAGNEGNVKEFAFTTLSYANYVQLVYPNGGECFAPGTKVTVRWNQGTDVDHITLTFHKDRDTLPQPGWFFNSGPGQTPYERGSNAYSWTVPNVETSKAGIMVHFYDADNKPYWGITEIYDINDDYFTISNNCPGGQPAPTTVSYASPTMTVVRGAAKLEDGKPVDAFVWAWSEGGRSRAAKAGFDGKFEMALDRGERWHIGAARDIDGFPYRSFEIVISVTAQASESIELVLRKARTEPLPQPVLVTKSSAEQIVIELQDTARVVVPPAAVPTSPTITVEITPTTEAPSQRQAKVISTVYDITLQDQAGQKVQELQQEIEITLPYKDEDVKTHGVKEDDLVPASYDEDEGEWKTIENHTKDKEKNEIKARVKHLTRFAIISAADIIPPEAPTNKKAVALEGGKVKLSWTNPATDFRHVRIYRSQTQGKFGQVVFDNITSTAVIDSRLTAGTTYYYLIRAVDPGGNESVNTIQLKVNTIPPEEPEPEIQPLATSSMTTSTEATTTILQIEPPALKPEPELEIQPPAPEPRRGFFSRLWQAIVSFFKNLFQKIF